MAARDGFEYSVIYPKHFFTTMDIREEEGLVFVLMPFGQPYDEIYNDLIKPAIQQLGMRCLRSDEIFSAKPIMQDILQGIATASIIIADVTGRNPNVFYELGIAHSIKDRVIIITRSIDDVPFDLKHIRTIVYEPSLRGSREFAQKLEATIETVMEQTSIPLFQVNREEEPGLGRLQERFREVIELQHQLGILLPRVRVGLQPEFSFNIMPAYKKDYDQLVMTYQKWGFKASELLREYAPEQLKRFRAGNQTIRDLVYLRPTCPPDSKLWFRETENSLGEIAVLIQELGKELTASIPSELPYDFREHFYDPSTQRHYDSPKDIRLLKRAECSYLAYPAIFEHPPEDGDAILTYHLRGLPLPPAKFRLSFRYGVLDKLYEEPSGALIGESDFRTVQDNEVVFSIRIDGEEEFSSPQYGHVWSPIIERGPLRSPHGDLTVEFRTNAMGEPRGNWAAWGNPILELYQ